jgi:hypothetical protein
VAVILRLVSTRALYLVNVTDAGVGYVFLAETSGAVSLATISLPSGLAVTAPIACYWPFTAACGNTSTTTTAYRIPSG